MSGVFADTVALSRLQFALTAIFHMLWPVLIGEGPWSTKLQQAQEVYQIHGGGDIQMFMNLGTNGLVIRSHVQTFIIFG